MSKEIKKARIEEGMSFEDYRKEDAISQSALKNLDRCPAYFEYRKNNPMETPAMRFGRMMHAYILEPEEFEKEYFVIKNTPDGKKVRRGTKAWKEYEDFAPNREIIFEDDLEKLRGIKDRLMLYRHMPVLLEESTKELSIFWTDEETGLDCKARIDAYWPEKNIVFDLKTTVNCETFYEHNKSWCPFFKYGYHIQAAFYMDAIERAFGTMPKTFRIFASEKTAPYLMKNYDVEGDGELVEKSRIEYKNLLKKYKACLDNNDFSAGFENDCVTTEPYFMYQPLQEEESYE